MGGIASVLYSVIAHQAFFGARFCAVAPFFRKAVRRPNHLGLLLACWTASHMMAGRSLLAVAISVCILSGIFVEEHSLIAAGRYVNRSVEVQPAAHQIPASRSQTAHHQTLED